MATTKQTDITKVGPMSFRQLQEANNASPILSDDFLNYTKELNSQFAPQSLYDARAHAPQEVRTSEFQTDESGIPIQWWGKSQYDSPIATEAQLQQLGELRYENQPWYDTLANGVGKMFGTAGTTFVSSLVGLPYGITQAAQQGRWSALWDNDVTQGLAEVDKWLEDNMTNYKSQKQENSPWYDSSNLFSMNFIADDIIKNAGFTLGAAASMAVGSGTLGLLGKSMGFVNEVSSGTKMANNVLSALFSATGEGMIEARQGVEERNKLELQRLDDALMPEYNALRTEFEQVQQEYDANKGKTLVRGADGNAYDPAYLSYKDKMADLEERRNILNQKRDAGKQQIIESGQNMGNIILGANQVLLTAGNLIQFGKAMTKSFDNARHAAQTSSKFAKPFGVNAVKTAEGTYEVTGKNLGMAVAGLKGVVTEGSEEMNQQWIQNTAGYLENDKDANDYWKSKSDVEAIRNTVEGTYTLGQALDRGFSESWGDVNQWEQFVIGGLTGLAGSYSPTKLFNQDKTKAWYDPRRYGSWEGGAINEINDFLNGTEEHIGYREYKNRVDEVNKILQQEDFPARVKSMIAHTYLETAKESAASEDDIKAWKDADDKQTIHDIQAFLRAGKLDDLRTIYKEMGRDLSDDDIESIVKSTTKEITAEEDKRNFDQSIDEQVAVKQSEVNSLYDELESLQTGLSGSIEEARDANLEYVARQSKPILDRINKTEKEIEDLKQQKESYTGQKRYEGAYVDTNGNRTATNEEIKEAVQHNAKELERKLDSYLESIDYVNRRTNGQLTKDQEDNLAYLHNVGKESQVRMQKIMSRVRKQLPSKFLLKTTKTPEQLAKENASSDVVFSRDENTKEGYVEVDTSTMNDAAFADFFQREVMRGGNIMPEFAETADEKAAREADEANLSEEEKKKKAKERASKKWQSAMEQMKKDADEQWDTNWDLLVDNFMDNFSKQGNTNLDETIEAFSKIRKDLQDASDLFDQTGIFQKTLMEYMQNPDKVDEAKEREENKANKANAEQQQKNKFAGKTAKQINQEIADGSLGIDDIDDFINADLSNVTDDDLKAAQQEAKKSQDIRQKQASLKQHIQDGLGDNPTQEELDAAQTAMQMVDNAALSADNPEDISIDMPELSQVPIDQVGPDASIDDVDTLNQNIQDMLADAFNAMQEDENAQDDIPEEVPSIDDVEAPAPETGNDPVTKAATKIVAPASSSSSEAASNGAEPKVIPSNTLSEGAIDKIVDETKRVTSTNTGGTWRSNTTRHPYGRSTGTYHEDIAKPQFGEQSVEYKRSKAIWEYLNQNGAFDRMDNASEDRMKAGDTIHFMVMYLPEVFGARIEEVSDENKPMATVILMLNDNGEVIGDLPLAQLEPSYKTGNPTQQVKDLIGLQNKVFKAFYDNHAKNGGNMAVVDGVLKVEGIDNLNLTFDNAKKTPLVSKVKQVMRGAVPYSKTEKHTLNEVSAGAGMQLSIKVTGNTVAVRRGDKTAHKEIVLPNVGAIGQPFILLPTPSGEKIAIPFYTKPFDAQQHKNTEMYRVLKEAFYNLLFYNDNNAYSKEAFKKNTDVIKGLLQIEAQEGKRVISISQNNLTLHLKSLTDPNKVYDITVPRTGNMAQDAVALVDSLSGIPINISLEFINSKIETGLPNKVSYSADYNKVIGEIADVNLPQNTTHTVNGWFTIELAPTTGTKASKPVTPTTGIVTEIIGGRSIEINIDNGTAVDTSTGEVIDNDEQINLRIAQLKASKPLYKDKDFIKISVGGDVLTYDVKNNRFVKQDEQKSSAVSETAAKNEKPAYFSSMKKQLEDKKSSYTTYLEDSKRVRKDGVIVSGPRWQSTIEPSIRLAIDAGILSEQFRDLLNKDTAPYDRVQAALNSLVSQGISKPQDLLDAVEKKYSNISEEAPSIDVVPPTSGAVSLNGPQQDIIEIDVPTMSGGTRKEKVQKVSVSELKVGDVIWRSGVETEAPISQGTVVAIEGSNLYVNNALVPSATKAIYRVIPINKPVASGKTLQEIEDEMKQNKTVTRQNKDAWGAISDDLKLKLANEGAAIQLNYNGKTTVISLADTHEFVKELNAANMAAKSGNLQVSEAVKPMEKNGTVTSKEKEREARRWLAKNLPSLSSEERTQFVEKIARAGENGKKMWGSYRAGVIEIQRNAPMGTVYHEAFHYVMDMILSPEEKQAFLDIAKQEYGITNDWAAEERLANDFRRYAMDENATGIVGRIKKWFRKINDRINRYNRISDVAINQLFWKINNGELAQKSQEAESFEKNQQKVLREIRNIQKEKVAWRNLDKEAKQSLKENGLSEATYNDMSLEEKEQWLRCGT